MTEQPAHTSIVVGASRGLGRGIATALADDGDTVIAVSRTAGPDFEVAGAGAGEIIMELADATDPEVASRILADREPDLVVIVAGADPAMAALQEQTWDSFSLNWNADVRIAFEWVRRILLAPLRPGAEVVIVSSGAALNGSPASGGYAGAKATQRLIAQYAQEEAGRAGHDLTFTTVMPRMTPHGAVGRSGIRAYAERSGLTEKAFTEQLGPVLTPQIAGESLVELRSMPKPRQDSSFVLTGAGLRPMP